MLDNQEYLMHFGITGMKWGIRRFQNKDGTLTSEGKRRYLIGGGLSSKVHLKKDQKPKASEMSDQELRDRINRLNMEKQYQQLMADLKGKPVKQIQNNGGGDKKKGNNSMMKKIFVSTAVVVAADVMKKQYQGVADRALKNMAESKAKNEALAKARHAAAEAAEKARQEVSAVARERRKQLMADLKDKLFNQIDPIDLTLRKD